MGTHALAWRLQRHACHAHQVVGGEATIGKSHQQPSNFTLLRDDTLARMSAGHYTIVNTGHQYNVNTGHYIL